MAPKVQTEYDKTVKQFVKCLVLTVFSVYLAASVSAHAVEILPDITVVAPRPSLETQIGNPQELDDETIGIAHERSISDVLNGLPGLSGNRTGGFGQVGTLYVRGAGGQGVLMLDDIPLLQSVPGFLNLDTLPSEALQKAEIDRGPGAGYRSFQPLGGAVRLYTQDRQETGGRLSVEGGSYGILRETLRGALAGDQGRMTATITRADMFEGSRFADPASNPERDPSRFTQAIARFSTDPTPSLNWQGSMLYRNSTASIDKFGLDRHGVVALQDDLDSHAYEENWLAQSSINYKAAANWDSHLQLGYTQLATRLIFPGLQNGVFNRLFLANWRNAHQIIGDKSASTQWHVIWGGQGRHEQGESVTSLFSQERTMTAGVIDNQFQLRDVSAEAGFRLESYNQYGNHVLFKTAGAWNITPELTLRASGGNGFRIPSYTELLFLFFGNPNLKPEHSVSGNLGLEWYPLNTMKITLNGYYQHYRDLITPDYDRARGPVSTNIADASVAGTELDIQYAVTDTLDTGVSYSFGENTNHTDNKPLPNRPTHIARLWGQQRLTAIPITLWAETVVRSSTWSDSTNTLPVKGSVQFNAAIRYAVTKSAEIYLRGENLTNNRNPQFYGASVPGIAFYSGFTFDF